jgi:hypothetical protein
MKRTIGLAAVLAAGLLVAQQFNGTARSGEKAEVKGHPHAPFVHSVIFYLKKDAPKDATENMIADSHKLLAKIPSVKGVWAGRPSDKSTPKFAATDYQFGLLVLFENADGLKIYLDHDLHTEYVKRHEKHIDRVLAYDFANQKH